MLNPFVDPRVGPSHRTATPPLSYMLSDSVTLGMVGNVNFTVVGAGSGVTFWLAGSFHGITGGVDRSLSVRRSINGGHSWLLFCRSKPGCFLASLSRIPRWTVALIISHGLLAPAAYTRITQAVCKYQEYNKTSFNRNNENTMTSGFIVLLLGFMAGPNCKPLNGKQ